MQESGKRIKYHNRKDDSKNYNQTTKEIFPTEPEMNYEKSNSDFLNKLSDFSNFLSTDYKTSTPSKEVLLIRELSEENELLKKQILSLEEKERNRPISQSSNEGSIINNDIIVKYMDSMLNLQSKIEKLEKENTKLKSLLKRYKTKAKDPSSTMNSSSLPNQILNTSSESDKKYETLLKLQMNYMNDMVNLISNKQLNNQINDVHYINSQPGKRPSLIKNENKEEDSFSDLCFEESFDVNNMSNSQEEKTKKNLSNSQTFNPQKEQESVTTVKHKNNMNIKNNVYNAKNHHYYNQSLGLSGSTSHNNINHKGTIISNLNSLNLNNIVHGNNASIHNTKRSACSNTNYLISKAKQIADEKNK